MIKLKATSLNEASDAILVSFHSRWKEALDANQVSVFLRKRGPRTIEPRWVYVYVGSPVSSVIGRFQLVEHRIITAKQANELAAAALLSPKEAQSYIGSREHIDAFFVGDLHRPTARVRLAILRDKFLFHPPQSFMILGAPGKAGLDKILGFQTNPSEGGVA